MTACTTETQECLDCENERPVDEFVMVTLRTIRGPGSHQRCHSCCRVWNATFSTLPHEDDES